MELARGNHRPLGHRSWFCGVGLLGLHHRDLRRARGLRLFQNMPIGHVKVDARRGELEIPMAGASIIFSDLVLPEAHSIHSMHFLKLILARKVEDHASSLALQRLRSTRPSDRSIPRGSAMTRSAYCSCPRS